MLIKASRLILDDITEEDMNSIALIVDQDPSIDQAVVYSKLAHNEMVPWRLETDLGNTVVLCEVLHRKKDSVLFIWFVSGKGLIGNIKYGLDTLVAFAKLHGCTAIESLVIPKFAEYLEREDFKIEQCLVRKEIN